MDDLAAAMHVWHLHVPCLHLIGEHPYPLPRQYSALGNCIQQRLWTYLTDFEAFEMYKHKFCVIGLLPQIVVKVVDGRSRAIHQE